MSRTFERHTFAQRAEALEPGVRCPPPSRGGDQEVWRGTPRIWPSRVPPETDSRPSGVGEGLAQRSILVASVLLFDGWPVGGS